MKTFFSKRFPLTFSTTFLSLMVSLVILAQAQAQESSVVYLAHFEVDYSSQEKAVEISLEYAKAGKLASGNTRFEILQNIYRPSQFAIIESWQNDEARKEFLASAAASTNFRNRLDPILTAAYDERQQDGFDFDKDSEMNNGEGTLYLLTHVDIGRQGVADAENLLKNVASATRVQDGNIRFNIVVQTTRLNHFTVVEVWDSQQSYLTHSETESFKTFRHQVQPMMGSLYDERMYSLIQ